MRCRLITSWSGSTFQGLGCSPIKVVRELGSERRELLATLQSDLHVKFASFRGTPNVLFNEGQSRGKSGFDYFI